MKKKNLTRVLVLLVLAMFMVLVLLVLFSGVDIVKKISLRDQESYAARTAVQYLTTRVHQADVADRITARSYADGDALVIAENIDGYDYETVIYCYDGYLCELFVSSDSDIQPEFGEKILPAESLVCEMTGSCLRFVLTYSDGTMQNVLLELRSERECGYEE